MISASTWVRFRGGTRGDTPVPGSTFGPGMGEAMGLKRFPWSRGLVGCPNGSWIYTPRSRESYTTLILKTRRGEIAVLIRHCHFVFEDWEGVRNLVSALPRSLTRLILVTSVGVTKSNELPWSIMNLFGVLKYKKMGEDFVRNSGLPYTIIRPGRLTDGPYTSYDLNTLLKATAG
ncbi:hypothetical protein OSB04_013378 [Centaurea solstitialis]|uniref:NAD(P)-binding domain-containing protein n=1 Tax=Centaurea solstitialis TaxID=347529 RepID=A0AA38TD66_9ASTR|nr:hypothetical protein OSB04_013378 [Centaurea solstitialis]